MKIHFFGPFQTSRSSQAQIKRNRFRPGVTELESRLAPASKLFQGLVFDSPNELNFGPVTVKRNGDNSPSIQFSGGVTFEETTGTFGLAKNEIVSAIFAEQKTTLLALGSDENWSIQSSNDATNLYSFTGFQPADKQNILVSGENFQLSTLAIAGQTGQTFVRMDGDLSVSQLSGLNSVSTDLTKPVTINRDGVRLSDGFFANFVTGTSPVTFNKGGADFTLNSLAIQYNKNSNGFDLAGSGSVKFADASPIKITLGGPNPNSSSITSPGIQLQNGQLTKFDLTVTNGTSPGDANSFDLKGLTIIPNTVNISYLESKDAKGAQHSTFAFTGGATLKGIGALPDLAIDLGSVDKGTRGIVIQDGALDTLNAKLTLAGKDNGNSQKLPIGKLGAYQLKDFNLALSYEKDKSVFGIAGGAKLELPQMGADSTEIEVEAGIKIGKNTKGSTILTEFSLGVARDTEFALKGVTFTAKSLNFKYTNEDQKESFALSGGAAMKFNAAGETQSLEVTLGNSDQEIPGLVITDGKLDSVYAKVDADFTFQKLKIGCDSVVISYDGSTDSFMLDGTVKVSLTGASKTLNNLQARFGEPDANAKPISITNASWSAGTAKVFVANTGPKAFVAGQTVLVAGNGPGSLNGTYKVVDATTTFITYALPAGTGSIQLPLTSNGKVTKGVFGTVTAATTVGIPSGAANSSQTVTLTLPKHNFVTGQTLSVAGLPEGYNGNFKITKKDNNSITYVLTSNPATPLSNPDLSQARVSLVGFTATSATWSNQVASITAINNFRAGQTVVVKGMNPKAYNGTFTVISATGTGFTYELTANPGTATGFGTVKIAEKHGLVIEHGQFQSLYLVVDGGFDLYGLSLQAQGLTIQYSSVTSCLQLSGGVEIGLGDKFKIGASIEGGGLIINTKTGDISIATGPNGLDIQGHLKIGDYISADIDVRYQALASGAFDLAITGMVHLPQDIDVGGTFAMRNGRLSDIALTYGSSPGIAIGATGLFITQIEAGVHHLDDLPRLEVDGSITVVMGKKVNFGGTAYSLIEATGSFVIDANHLHLQADVTLVGGFLGEGTGYVDLNWTTGVYEIGFPHIGLFDNTINFSGNLKFDSIGNITLIASASLRVPESIPVIGGVEIASGNFALQVRPALSNQYNFVAGWAKLPILGEVGFKVDFGGDFELLDGPPEFTPPTPPPPAKDHNPSLFYGSNGFHDYTFNGPNVEQINSYDIAAASKIDVRIQLPAGRTLLNAGKEDFLQEYDYGFFGADVPNPFPARQFGKDNMILSSDGTTVDYIIQNYSDRTYQFVFSSLTDFPKGSSPTISISPVYEAPVITSGTAKKKQSDVDLQITGKVFGSYDDYNVDITDSAGQPASKTVSGISNSSLEIFASVYPAGSTIPISRTLVATTTLEEIGNYNPATKTFSYSATSKDLLSKVAPNPFPATNVEVQFDAILDDHYHSIMTPVILNQAKIPLLDPTPRVALSQTSRTFDSRNVSTFIDPANAPLVNLDPTVNPELQGIHLPEGLTLDTRGIGLNRINPTFSPSGYSTDLTLTLSVDQGGSIFALGNGGFQPTSTITVTGQRAEDILGDLKSLVFIPDSTYTGRSRVSITLSANIPNPIDGGSNIYSSNNFIDIVQTHSNLKVTQSVFNPEFATEGGDVTITVSVTNQDDQQGATAATNVILSEILSSGLTLKSGNTRFGNFSTETGLWNIGTLALGQRADLTITATLGQGTFGRSVLMGSAKIQGADQMVIPLVGAMSQLTFHATNGKKLDFAPISFLNGAVGEAYPAQKLTISNTDQGIGGPYTFVLNSGGLPAGLKLSSDGTISGKPLLATGGETLTLVTTSARPASGQFRLSLDNGQNSSKFIDFHADALTVQKAIEEMKSPFGPGKIGVGNVVVIGNSGNWNVSFTGSLFDKNNQIPQFRIFELDARGGHVVATPNGRFEVTVYDRLGGSFTKTFLIQVGDNEGQIGSNFIATYAKHFDESFKATTAPDTATNTSYLYRIANGSLPAGLSLNPTTGDVQGIPVSTGYSSFVIARDLVVTEKSNQFRYIAVDNGTFESPSIDPNNKAANSIAKTYSYSNSFNGNSGNLYGPAKNLQAAYPGTMLLNDTPGGSQGWAFRTQSGLLKKDSTGNSNGQVAFMQGGNNLFPGNVYQHLYFDTAGLVTVAYSISGGNSVEVFLQGVNNDKPISTTKPTSTIFYDTIQSNEFSIGSGSHYLIFAIPSKTTNTTSLYIDNVTVTFKPSNQVTQQVIQTEKLTESIYIEPKRSSLTISAPQDLTPQTGQTDLTIGSGKLIQTKPFTVVSSSVATPVPNSASIKFALSQDATWSGYTLLPKNNDFSESYFYGPFESYLPKDWTTENFYGGSGLATNKSISLDAYSSSGAKISQEIPGFYSGTAAINFTAKGNGLLKVTLDGQYLGTYQPTSALSFSRFTTPLLQVSRGTHKLTFESILLPTGYGTVTLDDVTITDRPNLPEVANNQFSSTTMRRVQTGPNQFIQVREASPWAFTGSSGILDTVWNGKTNPSAFFENSSQGSLTQDVLLAPGNYAATFSIAKGQDSSADSFIDVYLGDRNLGRYRAKGTSFMTITTPTISVAGGGIQNLKFVGSGNGQGRILLDDITLAEQPRLLPGSLDLSSTGVLTGAVPAETPDGSQYSVGLIAYDTTGVRATNEFNLRIASTANPTITLPLANLGQAYNQVISQSGTDRKLNYQLTADSQHLPAGLSLSADGVILGKPEQSGTFAFRVDQTDPNGVAAPTQITCLITVGEAPVFSWRELPEFTVGSNIGYRLSATGGTGSITYAVASGFLPNGVTLHPNGGTLDGTPTTAGVFNFEVSATDSTGRVTRQKLSMRVATAGFAGQSEVPFSKTVTGLTFVSGTLPEGISWNPATSTFSGTTTVPGTYQFTLKDNRSFFTPVTMVIRPGAPTVTGVSSTVVPLTGSWTTVYPANNGFETNLADPSNPDSKVAGWVFDKGTNPNAQASVVADNPLINSPHNTINGNSDGTKSLAGQAAMLTAPGSSLSQTMDEFGPGYVSVRFSLESMAGIGNNPVKVMLDNQDLGTYQAQDIYHFTTFNTPLLFVTGRTHTLTFLSTGEGTQFIDSVSLQLAKPITITGKYLGTPETTSVLFGKIPGTILSNDGNQIVVICPPGTPGTVDFVITTPIGTTKANPLTYLVPTIAPNVVSPGVFAYASNSTFLGNWIFAANDQFSSYQWAIGTTPGGTDIRNFTNNGLKSSLTATGLSLVAGQPYYLTVQTLDRIGAVISQAISDATTVDDLKPVVQLDGPSKGAFVQQSLNLKAVATDTNLDRVEFFIDGTLRGTGKLSGNEFVLSVERNSLTEGKHTWYAKAYDKAGNENNTETSGFQVDNTAPRITPAGINSTYFKKGTIPLEVTATDTNLEHVDFYIDGVFARLATRQGGNQWKLDLDTTKLSDGPHSVTAIAVDLAFNTTKTAPIAISVDNHAPVTGMVNDGTGQDVDFQSSRTHTIQANWTGFLDATSGITNFYWAIGTTLGGTDLQAFTNVGTATSATNNRLNLTGVTKYYVSVKAMDVTGTTSGIATSDGVQIISQGPVAGTVNDGSSTDINYQQSKSTINANWSGFTDVSGIVKYEWQILNRNPGGDNIIQNYVDVGTATSATNNMLQLNEPGTNPSLQVPIYFVRVRATNSVGLQTVVSSNGVRVDTTAPVLGSGPNQSPIEQTSRTSIDASWPAFREFGSGIGNYEWAIGTTQGGTEIMAFTSTSTSTSATKNGLTLNSGSYYYVSVKATDKIGNTGNSALVKIIRVK